MSAQTDIGRIEAFRSYMQKQLKMLESVPARGQLIHGTFSSLLAGDIGTEEFFCERQHVMAREGTAVAIQRQATQSSTTRKANRTSHVFSAGILIGYTAVQKSYQLKCLCLRRGENRSTRRKSSWSRVETQQTTPTDNAESGNQTRATLVGPAPWQPFTNVAFVILCSGRYCDFLLSSKTNILIRYALISCGLISLQSLQLVRHLCSAKCYWHFKEKTTTSTTNATPTNNYFDNNF